MKAFTAHTGVVAPMDRDNVDTDMIIPKQFLKSIQRSGFGANLFDELRYLDEGQPNLSGSDISPERPLNPAFPLNYPRYHDASILLSRHNFGCGSSREHAPWALEDYGFRVIIASSFADIFYNNAFKNGLLPVVLTENEVEQLFQELYEREGYKLSVDLREKNIITPSGHVLTFDLDEFRRNCLLQGLDEIALTLQESETIKAFEKQRKRQVPWLFTQL